MIRLFINYVINMDWGGGMGSGPHTSDSHTNKTQVRLFTGEIN